MEIYTPDAVGSFRDFAAEHSELSEAEAVNAYTHTLMRSRERIVAQSHRSEIWGRNSTLNLTGTEVFEVEAEC